MFALAGCEPTTTEPGIHEQMENYQAALSEEPGPPEPRIQACLELVDPDLAGDCALKAARRAIRHGHGNAPELCPLLPEGLWRAECWFEAAELAGKRSAPDAIVLCDQAAPFVQDCRQHLWQGELKRLVDETGPSGFGGQLARAQAMHDAWEALLGEGDEFEFRFWRRYYQAGLGGMFPLDLAVCEPLPALQRERCLEAGVASWTERLEQALDKPKSRNLICSTPPQELDLALARMGPTFDPEPHPRLERATLEIQRDSCAMFGSAGPGFP